MRLKSSFNRLSSLISLIGLLTLLTGLIIMVVLPDIRIAAWAIMALGVGLLVAAVIIDFRRVSSAIAGRRGRFSAGTTLMASIFIGITLVINAISIGSYHRFDTTSLAQFTLTSQTKEVLAQMKIPVQATCFFVPDDAYGISTYASSLLAEYQKYTDKLTVKTIDPDEHPDIAKQYGITQYQTVVFESQKGRRLVPPSDILQTSTDSQGNTQIVGMEAEHSFTSAILEVTGIVQKKLYFLTGHSEDNINTDYTDVKKGLLDNLYKVDTLDLLVSQGIPADATGIIIAGPQKALSTQEIDIIGNYLVNGGWVMILLNPNPSPEMRQLLSYWDVDIKDGTVVDPSSSYIDPSSSHLDPSNLLVTRLRDAFGLTTVYFPGATAFIPQPGFQPTAIPSSSSDTPLQIIWQSDNSTIQMYSLARTSQDGWLASNYDSNKTPVFNEGTDTKGPLDLGLLIALYPPLDSNGNPIGTVPPTRLVVVGDSDFANDTNFYQANNGEFFLNLVETLTTGKQLISINRKVLPFRRLVVDDRTVNFIRISSIGLLPLLVLVTGGVIYWRRR